MRSYCELSLQFTFYKYFYNLLIMNMQILRYMKRKIMQHEKQIHAA